MSTASAEIELEVERMGGTELVLSTNLALRIDGFPRSGQPEPDDSGAAVYFERKGKRIALACDRWSSVRENLRAIGMHLSAIRGQERWGVGTLDEAFAGYQALPEPGAPRHWAAVLGVTSDALASLPTLSAEGRRLFLSTLYRDRARKAHPDNGGTHEAFVELGKAYDAARREMGVA